jgi:hypothetical protein
MHKQLIANLATFLAKNDLVERTIADHRCSSHGTCSCSTPNIRRPWPCTSYVAAQAAGSTVSLRQVG